MNNVSSPCIRNCCLDEKDICLGCHRSLQEILDWGSGSTARRIEILRLAEQRASQAGIAQSRVSSKS